MRRFVACVSLYLIIVLGLMVFLPSAQVYAATGILKQINFQGKVVNKTTGTNIADGDYSFTFTIYDASSGGTNLWTETKTITVTNGIFQTLLGSSTALPGSIDFNTDNIYLGINFNSDGEMSPRVRFGAVPQAFNALKVAGLTVTDTTGTLTIPNGTTIAFSGTNNTTFTTTGATNITLPTTGTLVTLAGSETLTNKTIGNTGLLFENSESISNGSDGTLTFGRNDAGTVTLTAKDNDSTAALTILPGGAAQLTLGGGSTTTIVFTTDSTGDGEIQLPDNSIGVAEVNDTGDTPADEECLTYEATGTQFQWETCGSGSNWRIANGGLSPINDTLDLLVGSNATSSAKFAVLNVNSGTPTASLSAGAAGGMYYNATGTIQTTANQGLVIGGSTTGNITINPLNATGRVDVGGSMDVTNDIALGSLGAFNTFNGQFGDLDNILDIGESFTDVSKTTNEGISVYLEANPSGDASAVQYKGLDVYAVGKSGNAQDMQYLTGIAAAAQHLGSGTISGVTGLQVDGSGNGNNTSSATGVYGTASEAQYVMGSYGSASKTASITVAGDIFGVQAGAGNASVINSGTDNTYGVYSYIYRTGATGGTINSYGYYLDVAGFDAAGAGTANAYGLYLENVTGADTNYSIYSAGGQSYFAGNVGFGDSTPSSQVEIGDGTDSLQISSVGDLLFVDANGTASITGPNGGILTIASANSQGLTLDSASGTVSLGSSDDLSVSGGDITGANSATIDLGEATTGSLTFTAGSTGDYIFSNDADSNVQITAAAVPGVDMVALSNSGQVVVADGVDGLSVDFRTGDGTNPTNSGINLAMTSGGTAAGDVLNGIKLSLSGTSGTERAIDLGTGWDASLYSTGNITAGGTATGTSATQFVLPVKTDSGDPTTTQTNGAIYYNSNSGKFRCYENSAWANCIGSAGSTAWDAIGDPSGNGAIAFGSTVQTMDWAAMDANADFFSFNFTNAGTSAGTDAGVVINNALASSATDTTTEALLKIQQLDNTTSGTTVVTNALLIDTNPASGTSAGITNGVQVTNTSGAITTGLLVADTAGGAITTGLSVTGTVVTAVDASDANITNAISAGTNVIAITTGTIGSNAATVIDFSTFDLSSAGVVTLAGAQTADITTQSNNALTLTPGGTGQLVLNSANTSASAVDINATGVVAGAAITLDTTNGGISLTAAGASNGDIIVNAADTLLLDSAGVLELNSSAGVISIGNDAVAQNINIGTAGARTLAFGSASAAGMTFTTDNNADTDFTFAGGATFNDDFVISAGAGEVTEITRTLTNNTSENGVTLTTTASDTGAGTTAQYGLYIDNAASTEALDGALVVNNTDADDTVGAGVLFAAGGAGTDFTYGVDFAAATFGTAELRFKNSGTLSETSAGTWTFDKSAAGTVVLVATDDDTNSALTIQSSGTGALMLNPTGAGQVVLTTTNTSASALDLNANGTVAGAAITLDTTDGGISLSAAGATNGDVTLTAADDAIIDGTNFDLASTGLVTLLGGLTTDISSQSNNNITVLPGGTGDFVNTIDADSNVQFTATGVSAADMIAITNSGQAITADTVDGISLTFVTGDGTNPTNSGINLALTSGGTASGDVLNGIKLSLSGTSGTERGIDLGTGWDASLYSTGNITLGGTATGTSATQFVLPVKTDSGDPTTTQTNGAIYYNSNSGKFRCYENSAWANCIGSGGTSALDTLTAATTDDTALSSGDNTIEWDWALTSATSKAFTIGESAASTGGSGDQHLLKLVTASGSTAGPLEIVSTSADSGDIEFNLASSGDFEIQDAGTAFFTFGDDKSVAYNPLHSVGMTITSDLSGGARSTDVLTITQANNASNNMTGNLLQLTNSDSGSTAALLEISQQTAGIGMKIAGANTSGTGITLESTFLTSGKMIDVAGAGSSSLAMTGDMVSISRAMTISGAVNETGNYLDVSRAITTTNTVTESGDLVTFASNCTVSSGSCTDTANILSLTQSYASATGSVLDITNAGTGQGILLTSSSTGILAQLDSSGAATTADGLLIRATNGSGVITDGIDLSDAEIVNALNIGANIIATGDNDGTIGDATTNLWNIVTDGTGNAEVVLPNDSIGVNEIDEPTALGAGDDEECLTYENSTGAFEFQSCGSASTPDFDAVYAQSITNTNLTMEIDDTGGLAFNMTTTGNFLIEDGGNAIATFGNDGVITFAPGATTAGSDFVLNEAAGTNFQIADSAATTVDMMSIIGDSGTTTDGADGLSIEFTQGTDTNGTDSNAALRIAVTPGSESNNTIVAIDIDNTTPGSATEKGIRIGSGFDHDLEFVDTTPVIRLADGAQLSYYDSSGNNLYAGVKEYFTGANYMAYEANGFVNIDGNYFQDNYNLSYQAGTTTVTADVSLTSAFGDYREWVFDEAGTGNTTNTHTVMGGCAAGQNTAGMATNATNMGMLWLGLDSGGTFTNTQNDVGCRFAMANGTGTRTIPMLFPAKKYIQYFKVQVSANFTNATVSNRYIRVGANNYSQTYPDEQNVTNTNSGGIYMGNLRSTLTAQVGGSVWSGFTKRGTNILTADCNQNIVTATNQFALMRIEARDTNDIRFFMDNDVSDGISLTECASGISDTNAIPTWGLNPIIEIENNTSNMNGATNQWTMYVDLYAHVQDDRRPDAGQVLAAESENPVAQAAAEAPVVPAYDPISGADLAENYLFPDGGVGAGDVVILGNIPGYASRTSLPNDRRILGVIAESPALVMGEGREGTMPVALTGRVRTRVSTVGGKIKIGDPITSSMIPGVAMKSVNPGRIIGVAMENYDADEEGVIMVNINPGYYLGEELGEQLIELGDELAMTPDPMASESALIASDSASLSATDSAEPASVAQGFVHRVSNFMKGMNVSGVFQSFGDAVFKGPSTFFARVFFKQDVAFEGKVEFNKDSAGYAKIEKGERFVDVVFEQEYAAPPVVNATLLVPQITEDQLSQKISEGFCDNTDTVDTCQDKVADKILGSGVKYVVIGQSTQGFMIKLNKAAEYDLTLSWNAIAVKDATTFKSKSTQLGPTPTEAQSSNPTPSNTTAPPSEASPEPSDTSISPSPTPESLPSDLPTPTPQVTEPPPIPSPTTTDQP